jgi:type I restriction enzyme M protein
MNSQAFKEKATTLIDDLKGVCANYGLGNDGNEFKIITQMFLYKFLNDKFAYEVKKADATVAAADSWEDALRKMSDGAYQKLIMRLGPGTARLMPKHFLATLYGQQNQPDFSKILDDILLDIATINTDIFSVKTADGQKVVLFDPVTQYVSSRRDDFGRAIINKLVPFSFEQIFSEKFDFYSTLFEYLIKDYNKDSGGKYAEYYTPHSVAKIMASCLVTDDDEVQSVSCYDPSSGSGTLLMNLAHAIGEERCTIYSEDISQKSSHLLRLNLILNNLVHSIPNVVQGNTILEPFFEDGATQKFDYIVSNPPFNLDFSDWRNELDTKANRERFFAGIPNIPAKKKDAMAIYLLFIQHILHSLGPEGKAAIVVPTGFLTAGSIGKKIRKHIVDEKILGGVISMPSNIFATTGTNVSILLIDSSNRDNVVLIDASGLGEETKVGKNKKTVLLPEEETLIIETFQTKSSVDDFSVTVSYDDMKNRNYSFSAGQYFEVKIEYVDISAEEFRSAMTRHQKEVTALFKQSRELELALTDNLTNLKFS